MEVRSATYRVMIVDDEAILRTGMLHLCNWSDHGIEIVAQASNGQEALQYIDIVHPHVVITDIVMPVMDGLEFTKEMKKRHPDIKVVVLSSYSEFDYVREVFKYGVTDYLLKPKISASELISLIQSSCSTMDLTNVEQHPVQKDLSLLLSQYLHSDSASQDTAQMMSELEQYFTSDHFSLAIASTSLLLSRTQWTQSQIEQLFIELGNMHFKHIHHVFIFLKNEILLVLNYDSKQSLEVADSLKQFTEHVKDSLTYIKFILSPTFPALSIMKDKHERLSPQLGRLFYFTDKDLVLEEDMHSSSDIVNFDLAQFTGALRIFAMDEAINQLKALIHHAQSTMAYDEYSLKRLSQNLIYTAISTLEQMKQPISGLRSSKLKLFKMIDLAFDIQELEHILHHFLEELKGIVRPTDQHLQQIYDYVEENYANEISLSDMADKLHLNYSYLSSYFKQRTHENLTSYISRFRTDKARQLLLDPALSVSEISRLTGFSDHNYFSKVFKKMTGMTPVEYRNQISN